jgi:hypothetical protein
VTVCVCGKAALLNILAAACRRVRLVWADGGYAGKLVDWPKATHKIVVQIVKRTDDAAGFQVLPHAGSWNEPCAWITRHTPHQTSSGTGSQTRARR